MSLISAWHSPHAPSSPSQGPSPRPQKRGSVSSYHIAGHPEGLPPEGWVRTRTRDPCPGSESATGGPLGIGPAGLGPTCLSQGSGSHLVCSGRYSRPYPGPQPRHREEEKLRVPTCPPRVVMCRARCRRMLSLATPRQARTHPPCQQLVKRPAGAVTQGRDVGRARRRWWGPERGSLNTRLARRVPWTHGIPQSHWPLFIAGEQRPISLGRHARIQPGPCKAP